MNVSAVLVTRGNVDMRPVLESLPEEWEKILWVNGGGWSKARLWKWPHGCADDDASLTHPGPIDLSVYGRYSAIEYASHDLCYVQDDDVIVSEPQAIVDALPLGPTFAVPGDALPPIEEQPRARDIVVCNMPQEFRHDGYTDSALVGFGAAFHRDAPERAFERLRRHELGYPWGVNFTERFYRTCDVVFTTLTARVLVDVPKEDREFASDPDRMWRQPTHSGERARMLELAREVRDA